MTGTQQVVVRGQSDHKGYKVEQVTVSYARKFSTADYESVDLGVTVVVSVDLDDERPAHEVIRDVFEQAKEEVRYQAMPILKARGDMLRTKVNEIVAQLPRGLKDLAAAFTKRYYSDVGGVADPKGESTDDPWAVE